MTQKQIEWAKSHDWFISVTASRGILARCECVIGGQLHTSAIAFDDFKKLKDFAGY